MSTIRYIGQNGLEYKELRDAQIYGGGCVGKKSIEAPKIEKLTVEELSESEKVEVEASKPAKPGLNTAIASIEEIREVARQRKVKGWAIIKDKEKLIQKIKETVNKAK